MAACSGLQGEESHQYKSDGSNVILSAELPGSQDKKENPTGHEIFAIWLTAAGKCFSLDKIPHYCILNAKGDPKQEMPSDTMDVPGSGVPPNCFPGKRAEPRAVVCVSWNCQEPAA